MQTQSLETIVQERPSKQTQPTTTLASCDSEGLLRKNTFQMLVLQTAGIPEEKWVEFIIGRTQNNLSHQLRTYHCLNLCPNRQNCCCSKEYGWVNPDEMAYPARFLNVLVTPVRNNPFEYYELKQIH